MLSIPWCGSFRKPFSSYTRDAAGLYRYVLQLTILMKTTFAQEGRENETDEQTPSKEKGDTESTVSSEC
jgi:hypothetical protein